jgi:hypothetical protein
MARDKPTAPPKSPKSSNRERAGVVSARTRHALLVLLSTPDGKSVAAHTPPRPMSFARGARADFPAPAHAHSQRGQAE